MPDSRRILRLQQLILETVATAVQRDLDDPRVVGVTITRVKLARDLTQGVVYWSTLEPEGPRRTAERGLADATAYLQARVAEVMGTRQTPRLTMRFDASQERNLRLSEIFDKLARERGETPGATPPPEPGAPTDPGDTPPPGGEPDDGTADED